MEPQRRKQFGSALEFCFHIPQARFALGKVGPGISERTRGRLALFQSFDSVALAVTGRILSRLPLLGALFPGKRVAIAFNFLSVRGLKHYQVGGCICTEWPAAMVSNVGSVAAVVVPSACAKQENQGENHHVANPGLASRPDRVVVSHFASPQQ